MSNPSSAIVQLLRKVSQATQPDAVLLARFLEQRDETAFECLIQRHGQMVLDVCRGTLGNETDAEDAFQATFLLLASKAQSIRKQGSVASWLHGVAQRLSLKTRTRLARQRKHEANAAVSVENISPDNLSWREVRQVVHEELDHLPERLRGPLVLCYLQGLDQDRAAAELGLAKGTFKGRLEQGRASLRSRLIRRGLGPGVVLLIAAWPVADLTAKVPPSLAVQTSKAALTVAAGKPCVGFVSAQAAALLAMANGASSRKALLKIALVVALLGMCGGVYWLAAQPAGPPPLTGTLSGLHQPRIEDREKKPANTSETPETMPTKDFSQIHVSGSAYLVIRKADRCSVSAKGKAAFTVNDDTLTLDEPGAALGADGAPTYLVDIKDLKRFVLNGFGTTVVKGVDGDELAVTMFGTGGMIASGRVKKFELNIIGIGGFDGKDLRCDEARIEHGGTGVALINASHRLQATITGIGTVEYLGDPEVRQAILGVGQVRPAAK